jgi:hypothetical protein
MFEAAPRAANSAAFVTISSDLVHKLFAEIIAVNPNCRLQLHSTGEEH